MNGPLKLGLITAGRGTMLRWLIEAGQRQGALSEVVAVVSDRPCGAIDVAREVGVRHVSTHTDELPETRDQAIAAALKAAGVNLVVVAGYPQVLRDCIFEAFPNRIVSMYPSVLPAFEELGEAIQPALDYGVKLIGMTFHFKYPNTISGGAIISQATVPVDVDDTIETVVPRLSDLERTMLFEMLDGFQHNRIELSKGKVRFG